VYDRIPYQDKQRAGDRGITAENMEKSQHTDFEKIQLMKALVWPVATYGCESWTIRKNEKTRLDAFEMKRQKDSAGFEDSKENKRVGS